VAHAAVVDQTSYTERLAATNFDKVLSALSHAVGDGSNQLKLIQKQLTVSLKSLSPEKGLSRQLKSIYVRSKSLGLHETLQVNLIFWSHYQDLEDKAFGQLKGPNDVDCLATPMVELQEYYQLCVQHHWKDEQSKSIFRMKALVRRQLCVLLTEERRSRAIEWTHTLEFPHVSWNSLSPEDWKTICRSVLLMSCCKSFCLTFGREKIWIESLVDRINRTSRSCNCGATVSAASNGFSFSSAFPTAQPQVGFPFGPPTTRESFGPRPQVQLTLCSCGYSDDVLGFVMEDGELAPHERDDKKRRFKVPDSVSNPIHWGHLTWMFCQSVESTGASGFEDMPTKDQTRVKEGAFSSWRAPANADPRVMLTAFYVKYNPLNLANVEVLLEKYKGNEDTMFRSIAKKYSLDPSTFGLPSIGQPFDAGSFGQTPSKVSGNCGTLPHGTTAFSLATPLFSFGTASPPLRGPAALGTGTAAFTFGV
jgi:hypothetical protein